MLSINDILDAKKRINNFIFKTPTVYSESLSKKLNNNIYFKLENLQKTGSFKLRGAFNHILFLKEKNKIPDKIVAVTSGNHGNAVSYICSILGIEALIYTSEITPKFKINAMRNNGANVVITKNRYQADKLAQEKINEGYHFIHPSSGDLVISGQGTILLESYKQTNINFDTVFASCGGGGLVSGIYITGNSFHKKPNIFAVEPKIANDAEISVKNNKIFSFKETPNTIADGARTLAISDNTLQYLRKISGFITVDEEEIIYWHNMLNQILGCDIETTSAMAMSGCNRWITENNIKNKNILVVISGGNQE